MYAQSQSSTQHDLMFWKIIRSLSIDITIFWHQATFQASLRVRGEFKNIWGIQWETYWDLCDILIQFSRGWRTHICCYTAIKCSPDPFKHYCIKGKSWWKESWKRLTVDYPKHICSIFKTTANIKWLALNARLLCICLSVASFRIALSLAWLFARWTSMTNTWNV